MKVIVNSNIDTLFNSGQVFRWKNFQNTSIAIYRDSVAELKKIDDYSFEASSISNTKFPLVEYFDLARDYEKKRNEIIKKFPKIKKACEFSNDIRFLKQDAVEMIISFILSANNNIKRISNTVHMISQKHGEKLLKYNGEDVYSFPEIDSLSKITEEDFRKYGAGYRAPYLVYSSEKLKNEFDYDSYAALTSLELSLELQSYKGIGEKVANCIMLFAFSRWDSFPIDTWIKKAIEHFEISEEKNLKKLNKELVEKFGNLSALVQQYLFYYMREQKI